MSRLIDADKQEPIIEELENICMNNEYVLELLAELKNQPTVDAEPVWYGKWLFSSDGWVECSMCGEPYPVNGLKPRNYCPACGAKMLGGKRE